MIKRMEIEFMMIMTLEMVIMMMMVMKEEDVITALGQTGCYIYSPFSHTHTFLNVQLFPSYFVYQGP